MQLAAALRRKWLDERASWDADVAGGDKTDADLWADLPILDSKTVARMSPLFKEHLGRPLDINRIRPGGYSDIEAMIRHLVFEADDSD